MTWGTGGELGKVIRTAKQKGKKAAAHCYAGQRMCGALRTPHLCIHAAIRAKAQNRRHTVMWVSRCAQHSAHLTFALRSRSVLLDWAAGAERTLPSCPSTRMYKDAAACLYAHHWLGTRARLVYSATRYVMCECANATLGGPGMVGRIGGATLPARAPLALTLRHVAQVGESIVERRLWTNNVSILNYFHDGKSGGTA